VANYIFCCIFTSIDCVTEYFSTPLTSSHICYRYPRWQTSVFYIVPFMLRSGYRYACRSWNL